MKIRTVAAAAAVAAATLFQSCASHNTIAESYLAPYRLGDFDAAANASGVVVQDSADRNQILYLLEHGAVLRAARRYAESDAVFNDVYEKIDAIGDPRGTKIREEIAAAVTNPTVLTYRGTNYDRVMSCTYQILNAMMAGHAAEARVAAKRTEIAQKDAEDNFQKKIQAQEEAITEAANSESKAKSAQNVDPAAVKANPGVSQAAAGAHRDLEQLFKPYAGFINPYSDLLCGLFFLHMGSDSSDRAQAAFFLKRARGIIGAQPSLDADIETATNGAPADGVTYVILESGLAPMREQVAITIPSIFPHQPPVGIAFPKLVPCPDGVGALTALAGAEAAPTADICNIDSVVSHEFDNDIDLVIFHTAMSAITRAAIAFAGEEVMRKQDKGGLGTLLWKIGTSIATYVLNDADLRTWRTLPKHVSYCRLKTPDDRRVTLEWTGGSAQVDLLPGKVNLVFVKSVTVMAPVSVSQCVLK